MLLLLQQISATTYTINIINIDLSLMAKNVFDFDCV